jgi:type I restriction enzyme M protein
MPKDYLKRIDAASLSTNDPRELERRTLLDTYKTFGCETGEPTYRYSLLDGVRDGFLVNPVVADARTEITAQLLSENGYAVIIQDQEGTEGEEIFVHKEFEKKFFSENTNRAFCKVFLDNALRDPISGEIGKTIAFCVSQNHAAKIAQILNQYADAMFPGEYKRYRWSNIFDPRLGGHEMLNLYAEAIVKLNQNPGIPQLFRDIFKNAYLPYRDPETLKLFLGTINEFVYDHSENLGDAFEYLLSVLGSQGDAGQFRTPRNIIDFMVEVIDPQKNEVIIDPACGTAGFLISSYKHIMKANTKKAPGDLLTTGERKKLLGNFRGYDISPDMVRLSLVNLYLHGFSQPRIYEYDTLTSDERWNEYAGVLLANPPFMSPKGGIKPHKRFSVQSNRSEVLFVDYIAEHLATSGRAAVIVPEGIIFQSGTAYKQLRKMLVEKYLYAVVSLPAGVFNPYSGVKTSILFLDPSLARKSDSILFVKIENDGFSLGAQRRAIDKNDLPEAVKVIGEFRKELTQRRRGAEERSEEFLSRTSTNKSNYLIVSKDKIAEGGEYNLSGEMYRVVERQGKQQWPMVKIGDQELFSVESGGTPDSKNKAYWDGDIHWATLIDLPQNNYITIINDTQRKITQAGLKNSSAKIIPSDSVVVSTRATIGRVGINKIPICTNQGFKNVVIKDETRINYTFLAYMIKQLVPKMEVLASGGTFKEISKTNFCSLEIPLPPIEIQREIVAEIEENQKAVEKCKNQIELHEDKIRHIVEKVWK